jgi:hypothetical protein
MHLEQRCSKKHLEQRCGNLVESTAGDRGRKKNRRELVKNVSQLFLNEKEENTGRVRRE